MFAVVGLHCMELVREPKQVFTLLETLYGAFDTIADAEGVFKVETIGDSYVAVGPSTPERTMLCHGPVCT
jgi:class 3 adenylate cyclase